MDLRDVAMAKRLQRNHCCALPLSTGGQYLTTSGQGYCLRPVFFRSEVRLTGTLCKLEPLAVQVFHHTCLSASFCALRLKSFHPEVLWA